jgi:plasmid stability protein
VRDTENARNGYSKEVEVRKLTVSAVVDTEVEPLVITKAIRQRLGLEIESEELEGIHSNRWLRQMRLLRK